ncbi:hypothetical protein TURU_093182 [Turdus rufiventris]|nr:hypothetical protein TURU_093182 [Turdus rufiventris]
MGQKIPKKQDDNFMEQVLRKPTGKDALLDLLLVNREDVMSKVVTGAYLGHSDHGAIEAIEFKISVDRRKSASKSSILDERRAELRLLKELVTKVPWENAFAEGRGLEEIDREQRGTVQRKLIFIQNKIVTVPSQVTGLISIQFCQPNFLVTYFKGHCDNHVDSGSFIALFIAWKSGLQSQEQRGQEVASWLQHCHLGKVFIKATGMISIPERGIVTMGIAEAVNMLNILVREKRVEIPTEVENAVSLIVWASDNPERSKRAEPMSTALKPGATPVQTVEEVHSSQTDLKDMPLENPDWELFTGGSSFMRNGRRMTGNAVTTQAKVIEAKTLPANVLSRKAEQIALTRALDLSKGKKPISKVLDAFARITVVDEAQIQDDSMDSYGITQNHWFGSDPTKIIESNP